jgi:CRISPR-associated protein (TIGR02710 family)
VAKVALVITVGNTAEPILKAIEETQGSTDEVTVFLLYGRPFPNQNPSPFDIAKEAKLRAEKIGLPSLRLFEAPDPEDIDTTLAVARDILREVVEFEQVIVNFTGGTKVLSAAIVHAALTEPIVGELTLDYTGGIVRDAAAGRVIRGSMRVKRSERTATDEVLQQVMNHLKQANYRDARLLVEHLPERGKGGFVKQAALALYRWDEFDYESSVQILRRLNSSAKTLLDDDRLSLLAALVARLLEPGNCLFALLPLLRRLENNSNVSIEVGGATLLIADAIESAVRRLTEERPTDSVLRSYRAVEIAVQMQLIKRGINPWHPDWEALDNSVRREFRELLGASQFPSNLALSTGLTLLAASGKTISQESHKRLADLQQLRNLSYLEHGYHRLDTGAAQRLNGYAVLVCEELIDESLGDARSLVRHSW